MHKKDAETHKIIPTPKKCIESSYLTMFDTFSLVLRCPDYFGRWLGDWINGLKAHIGWKGKEINI